MPVPAKELTFNELAEQLRNLATMTAKHSQNWSNFEQIAYSLILQVYNKGVKHGRENSLVD